MKDNKDYTRRNRFNGETVELTPEECKKHDDIFYYEALATLEDENLVQAVPNYGTKYVPISIGLENITPKLTWYF